jgi:predicted NBD/HSP70 family sugar kinase
MTNYIGIDIGGTNTKIALVNQNGEISLLRRVYYKAFELTLDKYLEQILMSVNNLIRNVNEPIGGIGLSCPGFQLESGHGVLYSINMPILNKFDIKEFFERQFKLPVMVSNDLVAHSLAEASFGVGRAVERFLSVSLGTGIGHTFIYKGKPQLTINGISGDSGRTVIDPNSSLKDSSGITGSSEALCGVKAIEILGEKYFNIKNYCAQDIITMAGEKNDPTAVKIMSIISKRLALFLFNLSTIYFPELISLTGGQTEAGQFFIDECQKEFDQIGLNYFNKIMGIIGKDQKIRILKAEAGGLAGIIGSIVPFLLSI